MNYRIILDAPFKKEVKRLAKKYHSLKRDLEVLQDELLANPQAGVDLGGGLRKVRMAILQKAVAKAMVLVSLPLRWWWPSKRVKSTF